MSLTKRVTTTVIVALALFARRDSEAGMNSQGMNSQGMNSQGMNSQGMNSQGMNSQGMNSQGMNSQGMNSQGMNSQGMNSQGMNSQGMNSQGMNSQGMNLDGMSIQSMSMLNMSSPALSLEGMPLRGIDRLRALAAALEFRGIERADAQLPGLSLQGLQGTAPLTYTAVSNPMTGVRLQASPTDTSAGSYLYVPGSSGTANDIKGTFWNLVFYDTSDPAADDTHRVGVVAYVADVEKDTSTNSSVTPANDDVTLYTVYYRQPATGQWATLCPVDSEGKARAMAVPLNANDWSSEPSRTKIAFACTASGVASKCARNWGYKPWKGLGAYYNACLIAARADYCQNDQSFTKNGTLVDLFDFGGTTTVNPTVGLPYAPGSDGVMLHEEYQISIGKHVSDLLGAELMSVPPEDATLVTTLWASGLESSRYADLDPGRACPASPYIDRCDPEEPYACYRATNQAAQNYGPSLAVNSPRHCAHADDQPGDPLDPLCNECTNRVCQVDPTCCGDPGATFYPRALVWDDRCISLRNDVCRSGAAGTTWPAGKAADPPGLHPTVFLHGATGALEGIVTEAGEQYAEGWACDPDFPGASIPVQMYVGGALGAAAAAPVTATADQPLVPGWRENVRAECGDAGRHGFRIKLTGNVTSGQDFYVYGIDLNVPGAPFSLLRGGKKTLPGAAATAQAAIWTGWVEPTSSGDYGFCKRAAGSTTACEDPSAPGDLYRLWVNGVYVAGNWQDPDPNVPGAFSLPRPSPPPVLALRKGIRYPVRVEYLRPSPPPAGSDFGLLWSVDHGDWVSVPRSALYPIGQTGGPGLQGTFFAGPFAVNGLPDDAAGTPAPATAAVDYLWSDRNPPPNGLSVEQSFAARFEGIVVPPISGDYTFTADTDGLVRITVDDALVTDTGLGPPGLDSATCSHDICTTGGAVSRTCKQGNFCAGRVCLGDPTCCSITWDARCAEEVKSVCAIDCTPTPPIATALAAGRRYRIKLEYVHTGGTTAQPVRAAKLRLMWALPGVPRDVIPVERLYAETPPSTPVPALGTGLNAAYFSDAAFKQEYLDHVEGPIDFRGTVAPAATLAPGIVCGGTGGPACTGSDELGAPALLSATMTGVAADGTIAVDVKGAGAVAGATVTLLANGVPRGAPLTGADIGAAGQFTFHATLPVGIQDLTVIQAKTGSVTSRPSPKLTVVVTNPTLAPPEVAQPAGDLSSADGHVTVGGTGTAGASVKVTATSRAKAGETPTVVTATFSVNASGAWSGTLNLPAGSYDLSFVQTSGNTQSAARGSVHVDVAIPPLTVSSPADGTSIDGLADGTGYRTVPIQGHVSSASAGDVVIADGGDAFSFELGRVTPAGSGDFVTTVPLDYGAHVLRIFQHVAGLDGPAVTRKLTVRPPLGSLAITELVSGIDVVKLPPVPPAVATVGSAVTVKGAGGLPRTGLPGTAILYQGTTRLAEVPLADDGTFAAAVSLAGAGRQQLRVSQTARSLSGGGAVESDAESAIVYVRPLAPAIAQPVTGAELLTGESGNLSIAVSGTAVAGATVTVLARRGDPTLPPAASATATAAPVGAAQPGQFTATLTGLAPGTYRLSATATVVDASVTPPVLTTGAESNPPVVVAVGDVTPPTITVSGLGSCGADSSQPAICVTASDETGADVDIASHLGAADPGGAMGAAGITCAPAAGPSVHFPIGPTTVHCETYDAAGNRGTAAFVVIVTSGEPPDISGTGLLAEATGPGGAAVNYQIAATGYLADCSPPGSTAPQACTQWKPANQGMGFSPYTLDINTIPGDDLGSLYVYGPSPSSSSPNLASVLRLRRGQTQWELLGSLELGDTAFRSFGQIAFGPGSPAALYIPSDDYLTERQGIKVSTDGGRSWVTKLAGVGIEGIADDPTDPTHTHLLAWRGPRSAEAGPPGPTLYETHDGWVTWAPADQGLPAANVLAVAADPAHAGRLYASVDTSDNDSVAKLWKREGSGGWQPLDVPPSPGATRPVVTMSVAPTEARCDGSSGPPIVQAGYLVSRDGGNVWQDAPAALMDDPTMIYWVFDRFDPCTLYDATFWGVYKSTDGGTTWARTKDGTFDFLAPTTVVQDVVDRNRLYAIDMGSSDVITSADGGDHWTSMSAAGGLVFPGGFGAAMAIDPVDPAIAFLHSSGLYRTTDGGSSWTRADDGVHAVIGDVEFDPLSRNRLYSVNGLKSTDGGTTWTELVNDGGAHINNLFGYEIGLDPLVDGHWIALAEQTLNQAPPKGWLDVIDSGQIGDASGPLAVPVTLSPATVVAPSRTLSPAGLQMVADAARTVVLSWGINDQPGDVNLFSFRDFDRTRSAIVLEGGGLGFADVLYDRSDGTDRLFVDGSAVGGTPNVLYRARVEDAKRGGPKDVPWEPLGGDPGLDHFARLIIDPVSGGQNMFTIGGNGTLWESHDGGRTWQQDPSAPSFVTGLWHSPADGALFATIAGTPAEHSPTFGMNGGNGILWKRSPGTSVPPGARVSKGGLRLTCTGPGPQVDGHPLRAAAPGSTFPLGDTVLACSATDLFGNTGTASITIRVQDTTPPVISLAQPPAPATAAAGGTAAVSFAVTAEDVVDGTRPVTCTSGTAGVAVGATGGNFPVGVTGVTCASSDTRGNASSLSFSVVVSEQGAPPIGPPTLAVPTDAVLEAAGSNGATGATLAVSAATAGGAPLPVTCVPALASTFPIGSTTVSCAATDPATTSSVQRSFQLTVRDTTAPALTVPGDRTVDAQGSFGAAVAYVASAADVVDGALTPTCSPGSGAVFPLGTTVVDCKAVDRAGNQAFARFKITVADRSAPVLSLPAMAPVDAETFAGARVTYTPAPGARDISGNAVQVDCTPPSGTLLPIGDTTVSCVAGTGARQAHGTFVVTVADLSPPALSVPAGISAEAAGPGGAAVPFSASATDLVTRGLIVPQCRRATGSGVPALVTSGAVFPVGDSLVTCTAKDEAGNVGSASFTVLVRDTTPPALTVPAPITVLGDSGGGAAVTFAASAVDAVSGSLAATCTPASGSRFPLGSSAVSCVARDAAGNEARGSFTVTVNSPNTPPALALPGPIVVEATGPGGAPVAYLATATDTQDGVLVPACAPASGATFPLGTTSVACVATDSGGLQASGAFPVTVEDTTPPKLTLPAAITVDAGPGGTASVAYSATATDLVGGTITPTCAPASGTKFPIGTTSVGCTAKDAAGNLGSGSFTITVRNTPPVVTVPANLIVEATASTGAPVTFTATATDAQDGTLTPTCTPASGATFPIAVTTVTCKATDSKGSTTTATFTVTVRDTTGPKLTVPADLTISSCASPSIGTATATDVVSPPVTVTSNKPTTFPLGTTVVTYTATDARGNKTTGTQRVTAILGDDASCCPAGTTIIKGTPNNDTLIGTAGRDCILGLGGQDRISGNGGDDFISGGAGDDIIDGGSGNDQIWGGSGQDQITGGDGADVIDAGIGDDIVHAGNGNDVVHGGPGRDQLYGEGDDDQLFGDDDDDTLDGGPGNDTLNGGPGNDSCTGGAGTNTITLCNP